MWRGSRGSMDSHSETHTSQARSWTGMGMPVYGKADKRFAGEIFG